MALVVLPDLKTDHGMAEGTFIAQSRQNKSLPWYLGQEPATASHDTYINGVRSEQEQYLPGLVVVTNLPSYSPSPPPRSDGWL